MTQKTIYSILSNRAETSPDGISILGLGRNPITYGQLLEQVTESAKRLLEFGINRNDRVAIVLPNGPEMATAFLSISSRATAAPLNPAYQAPEFDFFLSDLGAKALVTQHNFGTPALQVADKLGIPIIELFPDPTFSGRFTLAGESIQSYESISDFAGSEDCALVLHTSGTTSRPKIVPLTQANLTTSAKNIKKTLKLLPEDRCLNIMPLFHIHGLMAATLASLLAGSSLVCTPGFYAPKFFDWVS
jgi:acyl-CoA synthetase (AMP-forming)/AMP-acid ligase II